MGLLNVLEERDIQIRGHRIRSPSTRCSSPPPTPRTTPIAVASSRPSKIAMARRSAPTIPRISISRSPSWSRKRYSVLRPVGHRVNVPIYMKEIVAEITHQARQSPDINQRSGVSVRASVANDRNDAGKRVPTGAARR